MIRAAEASIVSLPARSRGSKAREVLPAELNVKSGARVAGLSVASGARASCCAAATARCAHRIRHRSVKSRAAGRWRREDAAPRRQSLLHGRHRQRAARRRSPTWPGSICSPTAQSQPDHRTPGGGVTAIRPGSVRCDRSLDLDGLKDTQRHAPPISNLKGNVAAGANLLPGDCRPLPRRSVALFSGEDDDAWRLPS
jgi:hypothetical protein